MFLSLALVLEPGCVYFASSGFRARTGFFDWSFYPTLIIIVIIDNNILNA